MTSHAAPATALVLAAVSLVVGVAGPAPEQPVTTGGLRAAASGDLRVTSSRDGQALLLADRLAPGQSVSGELTLANRAGVERALRLVQTPPADVPGREGGVLSDHLTLRVERVGVASPMALWTGRLSSLADPLDLPPLDAAVRR